MGCIVFLVYFLARSKYYQTLMTSSNNQIGLIHVLKTSWHINKWEIKKTSLFVRKLDDLIKFDNIFFDSCHEICWQMTISFWIVCVFYIMQKNSIKVKRILNHAHSISYMVNFKVHATLTHTLSFPKRFQYMPTCWQHFL